MTDRFVAVGASHKIATSDDGITWTQQSSGFTSTISCVRYGDSHWVAIDLSNNVGWSNDGITWHVSAGPFNHANALAYSGNEWIAVDDFGGVFRSIDGISWATMTTGLPGGGNAELMDVIYDTAYNRFYAVGGDFTDSSPILMYSGDGGFSWSRYYTLPSGWTFLQSVGSDGAGVLAVGLSPNSSGVTQRIAISTNGGTSWTAKTTPYTGFHSPNRIAWGSDGMFVAPGGAGDLATSNDDGATWPGVTSTFSTSSILDAAYGDTLSTPIWAIVGAAGKLATSTDDAATFTAQTSSFSSSLIEGVAFGSTSSWAPSYTFTADATLRKTTTATFHADAVLNPANQFQFGADAVLKRPNISESFTGDAMIVWDITGTNDGRNPHDRAELHFGTFPATRVAYDATTTLEDRLRYLWGRLALFESGGAKRGSFTASAALFAVVRSTFRADATIGAAGTTHSGSWLANAVMRATQSGSFTANADMRRTQTGSAQADAVLRSTRTGSFTADGYVQSSGLGFFTADGIVKKTQVSSATADALLRKTVSGSFTGDAALFKRTTGSFTANAVIFKAVTGSFTADAVIGSTGETGLLGDHTLGKNKLGGG